MAGMTKAQVDDINQQYLPILTVKNAAQLMEKAAQRSARARKQLDGELNLPYGPGDRQTIDIFPSGSKQSPVHVFIHGGYWRAKHITKAHYSEIAKPMVKAGATVALIGYELCPDVRITNIVEQVQAALLWIYKNIGKYGGDRKQLYVSGHSAGGHLTGMMAATDWTKLGRYPKNFIKGTAPISGLFDIEPHRHSQLQTEIRLTAKEAKQMSPLYLPPVCQGSSIVAVGGAEPHLFHWQSLSYAAHLRNHRIDAQVLVATDDNHFLITDRLGDARHPLTKALIAQMGL